MTSPAINRQTALTERMLRTQRRLELGTLDGRTEIAMPVSGPSRVGRRPSSATVLHVPFGRKGAVRIGRSTPYPTSTGGLIAHVHVVLRPAGTTDTELQINVNDVPVGLSFFMLATITEDDFDALDFGADVIVRSNDVIDLEVITAGLGARDLGGYMTLIGG